MKTRPLEDSTPLIENPTQLRRQADRDGFVFFRGLVPDHLVLALRRTILDYASLVGWLDPSDGVREGRAMPGKRIGYYQDPEWVNLQVHVQNRPEIWALGQAAAIRCALKAVDSQSSCLSLVDCQYMPRLFTTRRYGHTTASGCLLRPHDRGLLDGMGTAWRLPAGARPPGAPRRFPPWRPDGAFVPGSR